MVVLRWLWSNNVDEGIQSAIREWMGDREDNIRQESRKGGKKGRVQREGNGENYSSARWRRRSSGEGEGKGKRREQGEGSSIEGEFIRSP